MPSHAAVALLGSSGLCSTPWTGWRPGSRGWGSGRFGPGIQDLDLHVPPRVGLAGEPDVLPDAEGSESFDLGGRGVVRYSPPARILTAHRPHIAFPPHTTSIATPSRWSETSRDQTELDGTGAARPATRIIAMPEVPEQGRRAHRAGQEEWGSRAGRARLLPGLRRGGRLAP